jgi:transglutaminase-like putative cysteine protease
MVLVLATGLVAARGALSESVVHARVDRDVAKYQVNADLSYTRLETIETTLYTSRALHQLDRAEESFYPDKQSLEVVEAWVDEPDGTRVAVEKGNIFTRPSASSQSAPGFVDSKTTTVLFPRLQPGSRTHIVWRFSQNVPTLMGFNAVNQNLFDWDTGRDETDIDIPATIPLQWASRGSFKVQDTTSDGVRHIVAYIENTAARQDEPASVSRADFMPRFLATTLPGPEEIGDRIYRASEGRDTVTPEIAALAARIAGDKTGLDAARAIHAWVVANIRYVAVWLDPSDGYVPHAAADVLKAGYGDCKDYVVLMRALLAARGIDSRMAIVDWGRRYADPMLWTPGFANHAILYLPEWDRYVNPTDRQASFDALDRQLSGKDVLIVDRASRLARTPVATPEANRYRYAATLTLNPDGTIDGTAHYAMAPNMEVAARNCLTGSSSLRELAERVLENTPEGGYGNFESSDPLDLSRPLELASNWHSKFAVDVGELETFLRVPSGLDLYPASRERGEVMPEGKRQTPVIAGVTDTGWNTRIMLPVGMSVARLPANVDVATSVGRYQAHYKIENGAIDIRRDLVIGEQVVAPAAYPDLERLIQVSLLDSQATIVLTRAGQ